MKRILKYIWFFLVMKLTGILPDFVPVMRLRGLLVKPCFRRCGRNFQICSNAMILFSSNMEIGDDVYIAYGCWILAVAGVVLEDEVMLGPYSVVVTGNHGRQGESYRFGHGKRAPVRIGKGSWLGAGAKIMPGVNVGPGSLCAAGAVVTADVPAHAIVGGVPAKVLRIEDSSTATTPDSTSA